MHNWTARNRGGLGLLLLALAVIGLAVVFRQRRLVHRPVTRAAPPTAAARLALPTSRLRIGLRSISGAAQILVRALQPARLTDEQGFDLGSVPAGTPIRLFADFAAGRVAVVASVGHREIRALRPAISLLGPAFSIARRRYPGTLHVGLSGPGLLLVDEMDIERYLQGVVPGELPRGFGLEAQKALAVAARTYALVEHGKHGTYDLCDGTHCQMYVGFLPGATRGLAAVKATRHLCLWYQARLAYTFYSADCGGLSTRADDVPLHDKPAGPLPYLCPVRDAPPGAPPGAPDYCASSPFHQWTRTYRAAELQAKLDRDPNSAVGKLLSIRFTDYDASGRVTSVELEGKTPAPSLLLTGALFPAPALAPAPAPEPEMDTIPMDPIRKTISGWDFRRAVGALALKSTRMKLDQPRPGTFRFTGSGFGHGLGLCQIGANGMARAGFNFRQILAHYYPGTRLAALPE